MKAVIYLRVSTVEQARRDNEAEGYSIPAQRRLCRRKAEEIGAGTVREYVDAGYSARSMNRPGLQQMLQDVKAGGGVDAVIVHKLDRLARNLHDDVVIGVALRRAGVRLVSVSENIDETPAGRLVHGITAVFSEFYSNNLAAEALKGAVEKAARGGTPFRAPIGYINVIDRADGQERRLVELDPERASLVRWAFERFATGSYTLNQLTVQLAERGLRTRRSGDKGGGRLSQNGLLDLLRNRFTWGGCGISEWNLLASTLRWSALRRSRRCRWCWRLITKPMSDTFAIITT